MKKLLIITLSLMLALAFVACSADKQGGNSQNAESIIEPNSKMAEIIGKTLNDKVNPYTLIYKINKDGVELEITQAVKDDMVYMEFEYQGSVIKSLTDNISNYHYAIYDSEKLVFKSTTPQTKIEPFKNNIDKLNKSFTTGTEEINGVSYSYEKAEGEAEYLTLYFDTEGKLKYMDANGVLMEIMAYDATIDLAYFDIPDDYMMMEM